MKQTFIGALFFLFCPGQSKPPEKTPRRAVGFHPIDK
jgi:hypothetical protein